MNTARKESMEQITTEGVKLLEQHNKINSLLMERDACMESGDAKAYLDWLSKVSTAEFEAVQKIVWAREII